MHHQANVHAIIQAEEQSGAVVSLIDTALGELDAIDEWLTLYSDELYVRPRACVWQSFL